jgi:hypothetical protein
MFDRVEPILFQRIGSAQVRMEAKGDRIVEIGRRGQNLRSIMTGIKEHMEVIGADGVHVGTVDKVEGDRIKLTRKDSGEGSHKGHHHYIDRGLVAGVEGNKVRLSATGAVAVTMEEEK